MTFEEAIKILIKYSKYSPGIYHNGEADVKAFIMAIEALEALEAHGKTEQEEKLP